MPGYVGLAILCQGRHFARRRTGEQWSCRSPWRSAHESPALELEERKEERLPGSSISPGRRRMMNGRGQVRERRTAGTSARARTGTVAANALAKQARCPKPTRRSSPADDGAADASVSACSRASRSAFANSTEEPEDEAASVKRCESASSSAELRANRENGVAATNASGAMSSSSSLAQHAISNLLSSIRSSTPMRSSISSATMMCMPWNGRTSTPSDCGSRIGNLRAPEGGG